MLSTTQVLDAAVKTVNALHRQTPFDFGLVLGDVANSSQFNELRWFIDVMDGQRITPSSGAHLGADTIDYQKPYQAAGLDRSIPWYEVIGNHDQFWMGVGYPTDKVRNALVGSNVLNMGPNPLAANATEGTGMYMGVVDGTTRYGDVIKGGPATTLCDAPDRRRRPEPPLPHDGGLFDRHFMHELHERILQYRIVPEGARIQAGQPREQFGLLYVRADDEYAAQGDRARRHLQIDRPFRRTVVLRRRLGGRGTLRLAHQRTPEGSGRGPAHDPRVPYPHQSASGPLRYEQRPQQFYVTSKNQTRRNSPVIKPKRK